MLLALVASVATVNAQVCRRAGNVEVSVSPDQSSSVRNVTVEFTNYNSSKVTVLAVMTIVGEEDTKKQFKRTFVIPAEDTKKFSFSSYDLGGKDILPRACDVSMRVEKCEDE